MAVMLCFKLLVERFKDMDLNYSIHSLEKDLIDMSSNQVFFVYKSGSHLSFGFFIL